MNNNLENPVKQNLTTSPIKTQNNDGSNLEMVKKFRVCNFSMFCARIYDTFVYSMKKENNRPKISRDYKDCRLYS